MDSRCARLISHCKNLIGIQVGTDAVQGLVTPKFTSQNAVLALGIWLGKKRHKGQTQLAAGLHDANGDLAPIGNEHRMFFGFSRSFHNFCDCLSS